MEPTLGFWRRQLKGATILKAGIFGLAAFAVVLCALGAFIFFSKGEQSEIVWVGAWGAGWGGDTRHMWIYATDRAPTNQVASLDDYYRNPTRPHNVFRHIDGDWYLRADW